MRSLRRALLALALAGLLTGLASAQRQGRGFPGMGMGGMGGAALLNNKSVQEELKLTDDQKGKIKEVDEKMAPKRQEVGAKVRELFGQGLSPEEMRDKMRELNKPIQDETAKALEGVLKPEQEKRFKQIELQVRGLMAFSDAKVQEALKLSDEQKEQIKTIGEDANKERQGLFQGAQGDQEKFQAAMKKMATIGKESMEKAASVLKEDQKKTWKEMTGAPFELKMEPFGGRRRGGDKDK
jgi:Spy/CpxP family protein refolding chaperone